MVINNSQFPLSVYQKIMQWCHRVIWGVLTLLLSACASQPVVERSYFLLNQSQYAVVADDLAAISGQPTVSIRQVKLPSYLNQQGIATRLPDGKVEISSVNLWAEKFSKSLPAMLAQQMAVQLQSPVETHPLPPGISVNTHVEVEINRLLGDSQQLEIQARYRLISPRHLKTYHFSTRIPVSDSGSVGLVAAHDKAIHALAVAIAKRL